MCLGATAQLLRMTEALPRKNALKDHELSGEQLSNVFESGGNRKSVLERDSRI
jgi:hypothetical protein